MPLAQAGQVEAMVEQSMQQAGQRAMDALQGLVPGSHASEGLNGPGSGVSSTAVSFRDSLCSFIKPWWCSSTYLTHSQTCGWSPLLAACSTVQACGR